jgi:RHS repeat-associated protein
VVKVTSSAGVVTLTRRYDAWGGPEVGATESGYAFTGREWDAETSLYYYRARYYDPLAARFLSEDPIRLLGGLNLYQYVSANPTGWLDPFGLKMSPAECEAFLRQLLEKIRLLRGEFDKYNPYQDSLGGSPMKWGSGATKPYGHALEIEDLQRGIRQDVDTYYKECGNPPDPATRNELRCGQELADRPVIRLPPRTMEDDNWKLLLLLFILRAMALAAAA